MSNVNGVDSLMRKLDKLQSIPDEDLAKAVRTAAETVRASAVKMVPVNHGELRQSIRTTVKKEGSSIVGRVHTNKEYAPYVEFGTGPIGEANHEGISPKINPHYSQTGWGIPASAISAADADRYHMRARKKGGEVIYYYTEGQPAQPYMYPALKMNEKRIRAQIRNALKEKIGDASR